MRTSSLPLFAATVLAALAAAPARAAEPPLEIELRLLRALGPGEAAATEPAPEGADPAPSAPKTATGASLLLDLSRTDNRWDRVFGLDSESRRPVVYTGRVTSADVSADAATFDLALHRTSVLPLKITLQRTGDTFKGTYRLTANGKTVSGEADGRIKPARTPLAIAPAEPGEHPRILFRKTDLPALKDKLKTPLGQALFERMGAEKQVDAIGAGLKYQLTGEKKYADDARRFTELTMSGKGPAASMRTAWGRLPENVALAYDLCYDAWPADFEKEVETWLFKTGEEYVNCKVANGGINWHTCSNWGAKLFAGGAFCGLALWGEKGPEPAKPADAALAAFYEDDLAEQKRLGGANVGYMRLFEKSRYLMYWHAREAAGTGGFRGENSHYGLKAAEMGVEYAAAYRNMFGRDLSPYPDLTYMVPRLMFSRFYPASGKPVALDINGHSELWGNYLSYGYPIAPDAMKPALLWAWNRELGVSGPDDLAKLIASRGVDEHGTGEATWLFVSYPISAAPKPPAGIMPLTWYAPDMGFAGFRSGWDGKKDFVLQTYAKARNIGGWNGPNAGTFHLFGLGTSWNFDTPEREVIPWEANRPVMEEAVINPSACGRITYINTSPDGSGAVTMDLSDAYSLPAPGLYSKYGGIRYADALKSPRRAKRALAVDYSGKCGAPCLFVLIDTVDTAFGPVWNWNLPDAATVAATKVDDRTFTITKPAGTLRGTFVLPAEVKIEPKVNEISTKARKGDTVKKIPAILARGGSPFYLVATVQEPSVTPPEIKSSLLRDAKTLFQKRSEGVLA